MSCRSYCCSSAALSEISKNSSETSKRNKIINLNPIRNDLRGKISPSFRGKQKYVLAETEGPYSSRVGSR